MAGLKSHPLCNEIARLMVYKKRPTRIKGSSDTSSQYCLVSTTGKVVEPLIPLRWNRRL